MEAIRQEKLLYKANEEAGIYTIDYIQGCPSSWDVVMKEKIFSQYQECTTKIVENALELLDKEIPKYKSEIKFVDLCPETDPFMYGYKEIADLTIDIIEKLNKNGLKCTVKTKQKLPNNINYLSKDNEFGITLVSLNEDFRREYEPGSSPYLERINSLRNLHDNGFKTFVSIDPYPTPNVINQDYNDLLKAISFVDKIIFGMPQLDSEENKVEEYKKFYKDLTNKTIEYCNKNYIRYAIKNSVVAE